MNLSHVKNFAILEGNVYKIGVQTNQVPISIDKDGGIFNNTGYINDYRLSSSGELKIGENQQWFNYVATGFISAHGGDEIRIAGCWWYQTFHAMNYICAYDSNFNFIGATIPGGYYYTKNIISSMSGNMSLAVIKLINDDNIAYIRVSCRSNSKEAFGSKLIVLNNHITTIIWEKPPAFVNQVPLSIDENREIYNQRKGYKYGYRVRSGGAEAEMANGVCTGFIPVKAGDVVRLTGWDFIGVSAANAINVADSNFTNIGQITSQAANSGIFAGAYSAYGWSSVVKESEGVWKWVVPPSASGVAYIRVSGYEHAKVESSWDADMIVTINEEIA